MKEIIAFNGDAQAKTKCLARLTDEIQRGLCWELGKGCAVGCSGHGSDYETERDLGIPLILSRLKDRICEGTEGTYAKPFALRFVSSIRPGADLSLVWPKLGLWLLADDEHGVVRFTRKTSPEWTAIRQVQDLYRRWHLEDMPQKKEFAAAAAAARALAPAGSSTSYALDVAAAAASAGFAALYADAYANFADTYAAAAYAAAANAAAAASAHAAAMAGAYSDPEAKARAFRKQGDKLVWLLAVAPIKALEQAA